MSLWSRYVSELYGHESLEYDWGFVTFNVVGEACEILDAYVSPDFRLKAKWRTLVDEVTRIARERGVRFLFAAVTFGARGAELSLKCQLSYGFKLHGIDGKRIITVKDLQEEGV